MPEICLFCLHTCRRVPHMSASSSAVVDATTCTSIAEFKADSVAVVGFLPFLAVVVVVVVVTVVVVVANPGMHRCRSFGSIHP